jgi:hypothetical protein
MSSSSQPPAEGELWQRPPGWQPPEQAQVPRRRIGRSVWVLAALLVVLVAGVVAWRLWPSSSDDVQVAAEQFVEAAAAGDCGRAGELSTGTVADQLGTLCSEQDTSTLGALIGDVEPTVEVTDVDGDDATASVAATVLSISVRLELSLVNEDGEWLVSELALPEGLPDDLLGSTAG